MYFVTMKVFRYLLRIAVNCLYLLYYVFPFRLISSTLDIAFGTISKFIEEFLILTSPGDTPGCGFPRYLSGKLQKCRILSYAILGDYLPKEINVLRTCPGGEMQYIILLVHCVWTCAKVVLSGCITISFVLKMMSMLMFHFVVFVRIHHHHVSNKAFCSKKK